MTDSPQKPTLTSNELAGICSCMWHGDQREPGIDCPVHPKPSPSKDRFRKFEGNIPWELLPCRLCGFPAELWQRWVRDDIWCSFGACTNLEDVDGECCTFHLPDSGHFYCERKSEAVRYWNLMMGPRGSNETVEQRDGPSTCRQEGHDWKVTCSDCGEVRPIPYVHLNSGGHDRDAKIYSVRDVEALLAVGEAMSRHAQKAETGALLCRYCPARFMTAWEHEIHEKEHAQKANSCVCGEPHSPGTHRTDGPCLAPIGDHHP